MTGKVQPPEAVPKPSKGKKNATEIQQKLEQLLYYQKEKKAFEHFTTQTVSAASESSSDISSRNSSVRSMVSKPPVASYLQNPDVYR